MPTTSKERQKELGAAKWRGMQSARHWLESASIEEQIRVAGYRFSYGETLNDLRFDGLNVPQSEDRNFSWGFWKSVKGRVHHTLYRDRFRPNDNQSRGTGQLRRDTHGAITP